MSGIEAFSTVASAYEDWFASPLGAFVDQAEQQALTLALPQDKVNAMLEVGAGTGHIARLLTQYAQQVVAVEPSPAMRAEGQRRLTDLPVQWQAARAEQLPFPDAQFDGVVLFTTLEFVEHPQAALQEALRVVRPGGWLIVGLLQALSAWAAFYRYKGDRGCHALGCRSVLYARGSRVLGRFSGRAGGISGVFSPKGQGSLCRC